MSSWADEVIRELEGAPTPKQGAIGRVTFTPEEEEEARRQDVSPANIEELQGAIRGERDPRKRAVLEGEFKRITEAEPAAAAGWADSVIKELSSGPEPVVEEQPGLVSRALTSVSRLFPGGRPEITEGTRAYQHEQIIAAQEPSVSREISRRSIQNIEAQRAGKPLPWDPGELAAVRATTTPPVPTQPRRAISSDLMEDIPAMLRNVPNALVAGVAGLAQGNDPETIFGISWQREALEEAKKRAAASASGPGAKDLYTDFLGIKLTRDQVRSFPQTAAFSMLSMGASLVGGLGGAIAGGLIAGPPGALVGGTAGAMGAGGAAAYRMDSNSFMHQLRTSMDQASIEQRGKPLTDAEFIQIAKAPAMNQAAREIGLAVRSGESARELASEHGWDEAKWEALGNTVMLGAGKYIFGKAVRDGLIKKGVVGAAATGTEVGTEVLTQMDQHNVEVRAGTTDEPLREHDNPADWWKSYEEVAAPTLLTVGLMGAAAGLYAKATGTPKEDFERLPAQERQRALQEFLSKQPKSIIRFQRPEPAAAKAAPDQVPVEPPAPTELTHRLDDGTPVRPRMEQGKQVPGKWIGADGYTIDAPRAEPNQTTPNAEWVQGGVPYKVEVTGPGLEEGMAHLADGQEVPINSLGKLDKTAKQRLGMEPEKAEAKPTAASRKPKGKDEGFLFGAPAPTPLAAPATAGTVGPASKLQRQNRLLDNAAFVDWVTKFANNPDYGRLGASKFPDNGAPLASITGDTDAIPANQYGRTSFVTIGKRRVPFRYAVVEAGELMASHKADGTERPEYFAVPKPGEIRALNNGRAAGLRESYLLDKAGQYRAELEADDEHGIDPGVIRGMNRPVLTRIYADAINAEIPNLAEESQGETKGQSPLEIALQDAAKLAPSDIELFRPGEDGDVSARSNDAFIKGFLLRVIPERERAAMIDQRTNKPNKLLYDRIEAAVFQKSYGSQELTQMFAEANDPEIRNVLNALGIAASDMVKLDGVPEALDLRPHVTSAALTVLQAKRSGMPLEAYLRTKDMLGRNPLVQQLAEIMADAIRSPRVLGDALAQGAAFSVWAVEQQQTADVFGDPPVYNVSNSLAAIAKYIGETREARKGKAAEAARPGEDAKVAERQPVQYRPVRREVGRPDETAREPAPGEAESPEGAVRPEAGAEVILTTQTPEELRAKAKREKEAETAAAAAPEPKPKKISVDQADLFNTQLTLFEPGMTYRTWRDKFAIVQAPEGSGQWVVARARTLKSHPLSPTFGSQEQAESWARGFFEVIENANAARKRPEGREQEHPGIPQERNVPEDQGEVRQGGGRQAGGRGEPGERAAPSEEVAPHRAPGQSLKEAEEHVDTEATPAQRQAENYRMGHFDAEPMSISIETAAGQQRRPEWPPLKDAYGHWLDTVGFDKDHLDVFVKKGTPPDHKGPVYVVNQLKANRTFDEHKTMHGYASLDEARDAYLRNYEPGWDRMDSVLEMSWEAFTSWARDRGSRGPRGGRLRQSEISRREDDVGRPPSALGEKEEPAAAAGIGDLFASLPTASEDTDLLSTMFVEAQAQRSVQLPIGRILTPEAAAFAFRQLNRWARERFQMIGVDNKGKPIAFYDLFAGTLSQATVHPREAWTVLYQTPRVTGVWMAHNHPSGVSEASDADLYLNQALRQFLRPDMGVELKGHIVIGDETATVIYPNNSTASFSIPQGEEQMVKVPVMERVVTRRTSPLGQLTTPNSVRAFINAAQLNQSKTPTLILMDYQRQARALWRPSVDTLRQLGGTQVARMIRAIGQSNAAGVIVHYPTGTQESTTELEQLTRSIKTTFAMADVSVMDAFYSERGLLFSMAERGVLEPEPETYKVEAGKGKYQLRERGPGQTAAAVASEVSSTKLAKALGDRLRIVQEASDLPQAAVEDIIAQGAMHTVRGYWDELSGDVYLVAGNIPAGEARETLLHETVGHLGVEQVLGPRVRAVFADIFRSRRGDIMIQANDGFLKPYGFDLRNQNHQIKAAAEWIAVQAEAGKDPALWQRVVAAIRQALRNMGLVREWTDSDILGLLQRSRASLTRGKGKSSWIMTQEMEGKPGVSFGRLTTLLGAKLYGEPKDIAAVSVKEMVQNAFDALKQSIDIGQAAGHARLDIEVDSTKRTIMVSDNGVGMTPEVLSTSFLQLASTAKEGNRASGGLGIAKGLFLYGNEWVRVRTVRDGKVSVLETTGKDLMAAADGTGPAPIIRIEDTSPDEHGTIVQVGIPQNYVDTSSGVTMPIDLPTITDSYPVLTRSPLFSDIQVSFNGTPVTGMGKEFPAQDYSVFTRARFRWGTATIYVSKADRTGYTWEENTHVLSNGLWQFSSHLKKDPFDIYGEGIPRWIYIDVHPTVGAEHPSYPFALNRQALSPQVDRDMNGVLRYVALSYKREELAAGGANFGAIRYYTKTGVSETQKLTPTIKASELERMLSAVRGDVVTIIEGELSVRGRKIPEITSQSLKTLGIDIGDYTIPQHKIKTSQVMLHDNLQTPGGLEFSRLMQSLHGERFDQLMREIGNAMIILRDYAASRFGNTYSGIEQFGVGISFDKTYHGVHIRMPFSAIFVNPASYGAMGSAEEVGHEIFGTAVHEIVHFAYMDHGASYVNELQRMYSRILSDPIMDAVRRNLVGLVSRNNDLFQSMSRYFNNEDISPIGRAFKGRGQERGPRPTTGAPERGGRYRTPWRLLAQNESGGITAAGVGLRTGFSGQGEGPVGKFQLRAPRNSETIYGMRGDRLAGIARRPNGNGPFEIRLILPNGNLLDKGKYRRTDVWTSREVEDAFNRAGLITLMVEPPDLIAADQAVLEMSGRSFNLRDTDLSRAGYMGEHPRTIASFDRDFAPVVLTAQAQIERRNEIVATLVDEARSLYQLSQRKQRNVYAALELGRLKGELSGLGRAPVIMTNAGQEAGLSAPGDVIQLDDAEKAGYWAWLRTASKALDMLGELMIREAGLDPARIKTADDVLAVLAAIPAGAPRAEQIGLKRLAENLTELEEMRSTPYIPFGRWGPLGIVVKNQAGEVTRYERFEGFRREANAQTRATELREQRPNEMILGPFKLATQTPSQWVDFGALDELARMAYMDLADYEEFRAKLEAAQAKVGFRAHLIRSKNIPGYSTDFERATADYIFGIASYLSRRQYRKQWEQALGGIPGTKPLLKRAAEGYRSYIETPREEWGKVRGFAFLMTIAAVPITFAVNAAQPWLTTYPFMSQFQNPLVVKAQLVRAYAALPGMIRLAPEALFRPDRFFDFAKAPVDVRAGLIDAGKKGILEPMITMEIMGMAQQKVATMRRLSRTTREGLDFLAHGFLTTERGNRIVTYIVAHRYAMTTGARERIMRQLRGNGLAMVELEGLSGEAFARAFADYVVDETQFRSGKVNRALLQRNIGTAAFQFQDYQWQMIELQGRLALLNGSRGKLGFALMLVILGLLAGVWGEPFAENIRDITEWLTKTITDKDADLKVELRLALEELTGSARVAEMISNGTLRGVEDLPEMSARIGLGRILPNPMDQSHGLGVNYDIWVNRPFRAWRWAKRDEWGLAGAALVPNWMKNWIESYQWSQHGIKSATYGSTVVNADDLTAWDIAVKAAGGRTRKVAEAQDKLYALKRAEHAVDGLRNNFYYRVSNAQAAAISAQRRGDTDAEQDARAKEQEAMQELEAYNRNAAEYERIELKKAVLERRVKDALQGMVEREQKVPARIRGRAEEIRSVFGQ